MFSALLFHQIKTWFY